MVYIDFIKTTKTYLGRLLYSKCLWHLPENPADLLHTVRRNLAPLHPQEGLYNLGGKNVFDSS